MTREQVLQAARKYLGVPFQHQGRTMYGIDCIGLIVMVAHDLGYTKDDVSDYGRIPNGRRLMKGLEQYLDHAETPQMGDIMLFKFERIPHHVAFYTGEGLIHSYEASTKVVEHAMDEYWKTRLVRTYSFKGIQWAS
jgi:cell wall-associated NlpC family hydrolase